MKTANFPQKKQARRISALERMKNTVPVFPSYYPTKEQEMNTLAKRIEMGFGKKYTKKSRVGKIGRNTRF